MTSKGIIARVLATAAMACAGPAPSAPGSERTIRVLALNYDPISAGRPLHDVLKWSDPRQLAAGYVTI